MSVAFALLDGALPLACPCDGNSLAHEEGMLVCPQGHRYPMADGIPILLTDAEATHWVFDSGNPEIIQQALADDKHVGSLGADIDPHIAEWLVYTSGNLYRTQRNNLTRYPIPEIRLPPGNGKILVDVGCNWGRWTIAAARQGYRVVGIDPGLSSVLAARRLAKQLNIDAEFIVGDARFLPFPPETVDCVFSYSVLQHLATDDAWASLSSAGKVLKPGGVSMIQLANCLGIRSFYHLVRRRFRDPGFFGVRYYTPWNMLRETKQRIGPTTISVDGFFGLGIQPSDKDIMPFFERTVIEVSEFLRRLSAVIVPLRYLADSLYFRSLKAAKPIK